MNKVMPFKNDELGFKVQTVTINDVTYFGAASVYKSLGLSDVSNIRKILDADEVTTCPVQYTDQVRKVLFVNEFGVYRLITKSRTVKAKEFQRWLFHEVLPNIRKHGAYMTPQKIEEILSNPDTIIKLATDLKIERQRRLIAENTTKLLEEKVKEDKYKVDFAEAVQASPSSIPIDVMSKILNQNNLFNGGRNKFFGWLRENGYLIKSGDSYNTPTSKSMNLKLMEIKESTSEFNGKTFINRTPKITSKGQMYFLSYFQKRGWNAN